MFSVRTVAGPITALDDAAVEPHGHRAIAMRDQMLIEAAARHCAGLSSRAAARRLHEALSRFAAGPWRRERASKTVPVQRVGRLHGLCWCVLHQRDRVPSERQIRRIIDSARKTTDALEMAHESIQTSTR
jgi:hypothetical protein